MPSLLLCAAVEAELTPLLPSLRPDGGGWRGALAGADVVARAVGVGPVEAALGAATALAAGAFERALFLGTCGALPGAGLSIAEAVVVERSLLTSADAAAGLAYVPAPAAGACAADAALAASVAGGAGLRRVACATTAAVTRDAAHARVLADETGCQVEHLEAHGFLLAAARAGVPATCILGVANEVGPGAHEAWLRFAPAASRASADALLRFLEALD